MSSGEPAAGGVMTVTGPAVFGSDPVQVLCFKPCCRQPVRLFPGELERGLPVVVRCEAPRCKLLWTVEFPEMPAGAERLAVWRLQVCRRDADRPP